MTHAPPAPTRGVILGRLLDLARWLPRSWAIIDRDIDRDRPRQFGKFEAGVLITACIGLCAMWFFGQEIVYLQWYGRQLLIDGHPMYELLGLVHWVGFCVVGYVLIPLVFLFFARQRISDYYLGVHGLKNHILPYFALFLLVLAPVVVVSFTREYQGIYPFYSRTGRSWFDFLAWELAYGVQFFALELFFRGFLLQGLRRSIGHAAIFVMVVPYCMLHFQKTWSESLGAIVAGIVLGTMAMRYRSIWGGVFLHWMVAISMDVASLVQKGIFPPPRAWPWGAGGSSIIGLW